MPNEIIALTRDCKATEIPAGTLHILTGGTPVFLQQTLGGSFTISTGYQLMRIGAEDADALGFEVQKSADEVTDTFSEKLVWDQLSLVYDPEIPVNIVDLGLVYTCVITPVEGGQKIDITMSMTAPGCGMGDVLKADIETRLTPLKDVKEVNVTIVFEPVWGPHMMSEATRLQLGLD
ncbi:MAG: iron-sulfur cluster assembly protein [Acidobacteriaceae bacterium]